MLYDYGLQAWISIWCIDPYQAFILYGTLVSMFLLYTCTLALEELVWIELVDGTVIDAQGY